MGRVDGGDRVADTGRFLRPVGGRYVVQDGGVVHGTESGRLGVDQPRSGCSGEPHFGPGGAGRRDDEIGVFASKTQREPWREDAGLDHGSAPDGLVGERGVGKHAPGDRTRKTEAVGEGERLAEYPDGAEQSEIGDQFRSGAATGGPM
jgi:hypothetical protein